MNLDGFRRLVSVNSWVSTALVTPGRREICSHLKCQEGILTRGIVDLELEHTWLVFVNLLDEVDKYRAQLECNRSVHGNLRLQATLGCNLLTHPILLAGCGSEVVREVDCHDQGALPLSGGRGRRAE